MKTITWIKDVLKKKIIYVFIILIIQVALNIGSVAYALVFKGITDAAVSGSIVRLRHWIIYFVVLVLIQTTLGAANRFFMEISRASIENVFKLRLYTAIMNRRYDRITAIHSGEWMNRFTSDTVVVADGVTQIIPGAVSMLVRMLCAIVLLVHFCPVFGYIIIPAGIIFLGLSVTFRKVLKKRHKYVQESDGRLRVYLQESLSALQVIKAFSKESDMILDMKEKMEEHKSARMKKNYFSNFCNTGFVAIMNVSYIIGAAVGGYGILSGRMTYGTLIAIVQLIGQVQAPLSSITGYLPQFYSMLASAERLKEIEQYDMDMTSEQIIPLKEICRIYKDEFISIEFRDVSFSYKNMCKDKVAESENPPIFEHLNINVHKGSCLALTGHSGCGKSTFLKLMMDLYPISTGEVIVKTENAESELSAAWRHLYAYVPQENQLMSGTIRDIVTFGDKSLGADERIWGALQIAEAEEFVEHLPDGLNTFLGERGTGLSEGQMQRIAIARAIYSQAPILLLDESTSALDETTEYRVLQNIQTMTDKTILIVTHRRAALDIADVEVHFSDGRVVVRKLRQK